MIRFAFASLSPAATLTAACLVGGIWPWLALAHVTLVVTLLDRLPRPAQPDEPTTRRWALRLNQMLALVHLGLLGLGVWALVNGPFEGLAPRLATALALALYLGQVGNSNAHELIHRPERTARWLGKAVYMALLFGHHASAHPRVHHVHVASDADPNSARLGESFYRFWPRAWIGSFRAGLRAETRARERLTPAPSALSHPYVAYCAGTVLALALAYALAGGLGCLVLLGLATHAQMQLLLADYIQHYGLRRELLPDGKLQRPGPQHAWNAPHWYSSAMTLNAPRHSDHHLNPARQFTALRLQRTTMPVWPHSMPTMAAMALIPGLWRQRMDPLAAQWQARISASVTGHGTGDGDLPLSG